LLVDEEAVPADELVVEPEPEVTLGLLPPTKLAVTPVLFWQCEL
jgi:hypothetical protein